MGVKRADMDDAIRRDNSGSWLLLILLLIALATATGLAFARAPLVETYARHDAELPQITVWALSIPNEGVVTTAMALAGLGVICQLLIADKSLACIIDGGLLVVVVVTMGLITAAALLPLSAL